VASRARRLWIVDPSLYHAEDQGVAEILRGWPGEHRLFRPGLSPGDGPTPADGHDADGFVIMGSAASVHDRELGWLEPLADWLRPLVDGSIARPLLGICFGHQLVAALGGGRVGWLTPDKEKASGIDETRLAGSRFLPGSHALRVVISHREHVEQAPAGFDIVARRPGVEIDGLEHRALPIVTYQFHPEARESFARRAGFDPARIDERVRSDSQRLLGAFRRIVDPSSE
jgi:GMP synthase (glutamine-hydrolysing)